jgi:hypothetical protein
MEKCLTQDLDYLVKSYEAEECTFTQRACLDSLVIYVDRMEDCHLRAVLYKHLDHLEEDGYDVFTEEV